MPYSRIKRLENFILDPLLSGDISCQPPQKYAERFAAFVQRMGGPAAELRAFTDERRRRARRPLGFLVGEFGAKDVWRLAAASPLPLMAVAAFAVIRWRWRRW